MCFKCQCLSVGNHSVKRKLVKAIQLEEWDKIQPIVERDRKVINQRCNGKNKIALHLAVEHGAPADIITQLISPDNINMKTRYGETALFLMVSKKRWDLVPVLLALGADVNLGQYLKSLLHLAVEHGAPADIVTQLISPDNINMKTGSRYDETALSLAASKKRWDLVPVLLQHGADINLCKKGTPLYLAVEHGAPADIVTQLISPDNINMKTGSRYDETALSLAGSKKRWDLVPVLLQHGADVNLCGCENQTPLHVAAWHGAPADIITRLISPDNINMRDEGGSTVLHRAVRDRSWELVPVLLQYGADVNRTSLHLAVELGAPADIVTQLISPQNINMEIEVDKPSYNAPSIYRTPLSLAASEKRWELVPVLLQHGANVNFAIKCRQNPRDLGLLLCSECNIYSKTYVLYEAVMEKRWDLVPVLLQHGADVNVRHHTDQSCPPIMNTFDDKTSLHLAVEKDAPSHIVAQLISSYNINLGTPKYRNKTAFKMAFDKKRWDLVSVLLQHGADVNLCNTWSLTQSSLLEAKQHGAPADIMAQMMLQMALKEKRWDLVPVLLQHGADPSTALEILRRQKQVLHEMVQNKRWEMIEILLQYGADPATFDFRQSQEPVVLSLKAQCISTIRSHMPAKSDKAYGGLGLPGRLVDEVKLKPQAKAICGLQITQL